MERSGAAAEHRHRPISRTPLEPAPPTRHSACVVEAAETLAVRRGSSDSSCSTAHALARGRLRVRPARQPWDGGRLLLLARTFELRFESLEWHPFDGLLMARWNATSRHSSASGGSASATAPPTHVQQRYRTG